MGGQTAAAPESRATSSEQLCIACRLHIPRDASVCSHCSSYQDRWKNTLRFVAGIVGVLTASAALVAFTIRSLPDVRQAVAWQDRVRVFAFVSERRFVAVNAGDGPIFVSHVSIEAKPQANAESFRLTYQVYQALGPGQELEHAVPKELQLGFDIKSAEVVNNVTDEQWAEIVAKVQLPALADCAAIVVVAKSDPQYRMWRSHHGNQLREYDATATLHFYSVKKDAWRTESIEASGVVYRRAGTTPCWSWPPSS